MQNPYLIAASLSAAMDDLAQMVDHRLRVHFGQEVDGPPPSLRPPGAGSPLHDLITASQLSLPEQVVLFLALAPEVRPGMLEDGLRTHLGPEGDLPVFGGVRGKQFRGILPTGQTALFLLAGDDARVQFALRDLLAPGGRLRRQGILRILPPPEGEPYLAGQLVADAEWVERILTGRVAPPAFSPSFPAQRVETDLAWDDLVLAPESLREIAYLHHYLDHQDRLAGDPGYGRHSRRGYRAIFYGPPGTGKTLTAALLGKSAGRPVFRVDLSMVVSKWIGETEKNLAGLFERAESKGWILFFDEADALFSKRGEVKESRDKYANQETSFLLQRVENYDGLCILATNFRSNLDRAFTRRFEAIVAFSPPTAPERARLWRTMWPAHLPAEAGVDVDELARRYDLTGANIANALRHAVYRAVDAGAGVLSEAVLLDGIRREHQKEDRLFPAG